MKYSVCLDILQKPGKFDMGQFLEDMRTVGRAGYDGYEFWSWWDKDLNAMRLAQEQVGLSCAACCTKFISLGDPALRQSYLDGLRETVAAASQLHCRTIITQTGFRKPEISDPAFRESMVTGLRQAAGIAEAAGITLVVEPLNTLVDHKGYFLSTSEDASRLIDDVGSPNVKILFDIYHQQITEGNLIRNIRKNFSKIGHFHAAGNPGRHELAQGEINYPQVFGAIRSLGYTGYIGMEYVPTKDIFKSVSESRAAELN